MVGVPEVILAQSSPGIMPVASKPEPSSLGILFASPAPPAVPELTDATPEETVMPEVAALVSNATTPLLPGE
ncbi:hypothetical protein D3C87_1971910 [compost metagenome]